jgi:two-component system copper resistance phosphate regulon response regulator CusR
LRFCADGYNPSMRLLIVEDDDKLAEVLRKGLSEEGFEVARAQDGDVGLRLALDQPFDCILLDIMLPGRDGFSVCRMLRESGTTTPVVMLTVKGEVEDKVEGLRAGADDYLAKPFAFDELLARIHACIRRTTEYAGPLLRYRDLELNPLSRNVVRSGRSFDLTPKECALLEYLLRSPGRIVSEAELLENVWGLRFDPQTNVVNVYLHHLRKKVDQGFGTKLIQTVPGRGYRLGDGSP